MTAVLFSGTATQARYADLAEKYTTSEEYPTGTVMMVSDATDSETTACQQFKIPVGVISASPAYLMNSESAGQALALKGRVPIRIIGTITKGDYVYTGADGVAHNSPTDSNIVGIALESSDVESEKLVECVLKV